MRLLYAIHAVAYGYTVKSCEGNTYTEAELQPHRIGNHAWSFASVLTEVEIKGRWEIVREDDVCTD